MAHLTTRSIRSFVLRQGRLTEGQRHNLDVYWPQFGLDVDDSRQFDLNALFPTVAPLWLEVGFGNGDSLAQMAQAHPSVNFLGIEVHLPGVGHVLGEIASRELTNVRVIRHDALEVLANNLPPACLARLLLFFPDPWHKRRHHKRRIVNPDFIRLVSRSLQVDGILHCATDWQPYATWIETILADYPEQFAATDPELAQQIISSRPLTKFEQRGLKLGHEVTDLSYRKRSADHR